jgi:hypothetical protein
MQGSTPLGQVDFAIAVRSTADEERRTVKVQAVEPDAADATVTSLLIEEDRVGDRLRYRYIVTSEPLRLHYQEFHSAFFQPHASGKPAAAAYAGSIYRKVVERVLENVNDLDLFRREVRGVGVDLCDQLFDPEFVRMVWDHRDTLGTVWVTAREPYIPWELAVLKHPDRPGRAGTDDRFLGEYGLVRSLSGRLPPRRLHAGAWAYVAAEYPEQSYHAPMGELRYLTQTLRARGVVARRIAADPTQLLDALAAPDYDVLHIACHGEVELEQIDDARIILGDRRVDGVPKPITLETGTVRAEADLTGREPIVFLNACETGRQAPSLTDTGGWPRTFVQAGAGAFIGTSWPVREMPAAAFSEAFYDTLLKHRPLADAASEGRAAAKALGDASWLAYTVYGQPAARIADG